mmetsp:Transcript_1702/g.2200  ORF Transcript_1702/g.2200 Transcript_1702/m.2200 type:complete len:99 (-) Transcript_1702:312-608(-)
MRFLRDEGQLPPIPENLLEAVSAEFKFWRVPAMKPSLVSDLNEILRTDPREHWPDFNDVAYTKWKKLGPFLVEEILAQSKYFEMRASPVESKKHDTVI